LKKPDAALFRKRNVILPFEDATSIEFLSQRNDRYIFFFFLLTLIEK